MDLFTVISMVIIALFGLSFIISGLVMLWAINLFSGKFSVPSVLALVIIAFGVVFEYYVFSSIYTQVG